MVSCMSKWSGLISKIFCSNELGKIEQKEQEVNSFKELLQKTIETKDKEFENVIEGLKKDRQNAIDEQIKLQEQIERALIVGEKLKYLLEQKDLTPVDIWCKKQGHQPVKKVYKDKIVINNIKIPCDLRELYTPNSYLVRKAKEEIEKSPDNQLLWYRRVMEKVNSIVTWKAEATDN